MDTKRLSLKGLLKERTRTSLAKENFKKIASSLEEAFHLQGDEERIASARFRLRALSSFNESIGEERTFLERIEDAYSRFCLAYFGRLAKRKWLKGSMVVPCSPLLAFAVGAVL